MNTAAARVLDGHAAANERTTSCRRTGWPPGRRLRPPRRRQPAADVVDRGRPGSPSRPTTSSRSGRSPAGRPAVSSPSPNHEPRTTNPLASSGRTQGTNRSCQSCRTNRSVPGRPHRHTFRSRGRSRQSHVVAGETGTNRRRHTRSADGCTCVDRMRSSQPNSTATARGS